MSFTLTQTYPNGHQRVMTVDSYIIDEDDDSVAFLTTAEDGNIVISAADQPDLWAQFTAATAGA